MITKESKSEIRAKKHARLRHYISGTPERPRLSVFRSNKHMYAQIIDDNAHTTLVSASTVQKDIKAELEKTNDVAAAAYLGKVIAERAKEKGITILMAVHDLNLASLYADKFFLMKEGIIKYSGNNDVLNKENIKDIFGVNVDIKNIDNRKIIIHGGKINE